MLSGKLESSSGAVAGGGGEFSCSAVYPSPDQSLQLGRQNLHLFRFKNTRFDVIGGAFYFLMVVRMHPRPLLLELYVQLSRGNEMSQGPAEPGDLACGICTAACACACAAHCFSRWQCLEQDHLMRGMQRLCWLIAPDQLVDVNALVPGSGALNSALVT
jgi:hypothetical protein